MTPTPSGPHCSPDLTVRAHVVLPALVHEHVVALQDDRCARLGHRLRRCIRLEERAGREQDELVHLLRMHRGEPARPRRSRGPPDQADSVRLPQRPDVGGDAFHFVPFGLARNELERIARLARFLEHLGDELRLIGSSDVARIIHHGLRRTAVAGVGHRENVEAGARKLDHPAVVPKIEVVGDDGRRVAPVHEQDYRCPGCPVGLKPVRQDLLPQMQANGPPPIRRHRGAVRDKTVRRDQCFPAGKRRDARELVRHRWHSVFPYRFFDLPGAIPAMRASTSCTEAVSDCE